MKRPAMLGDQPISATYREQMNAIARVLDDTMNGTKRGQDRDTGFVLLVFPFGDHNGRCNFISNGADRGDLVALFKQMIARFEGQPESEGGSA